MRILHVIDTLDFGGAEKIVVSLANGAADAHDVAICALSNLGVLAGELDARVQTFSLDRHHGVSLDIPRQLARRVQAGEFDVIHGHNWSAFLETGLAASLAGVGCAVHTIHGTYPSIAGGVFGAVKRAGRRRLERCISRRFHRIVCVSEAIRDYIPSTVGICAERLATIHNGIADASSPERRARETLTFVTVGRLDAIKNQAMMLHAFARLATVTVPTRLLIAGDGPERSRLEQLCEQLGIASKVDFLGFRADVGPVLAQADVFLLSSRYEGISIALLEAMRAGLPAVATRVGGIAETVHDGATGFMVNADDVDGFGSCMRQLAESPDLRRRLGAAARNLQRAEFSRQAMLQRYEELYRDGLVRDAAS